MTRSLNDVVQSETAPPAVLLELPLFEVRGARQSLVFFGIDLSEVTC